MATYSKETALYKPDAIKDDIEDARKNAKGYMTDVSNNGVFVHEYDTANPEPSDINANGVHISNKIDIIREGESVAEFGEMARVGKNGTNAHIEVSDTGIRGYGLNGSKYFEVLGEGREHVVYELIESIEGVVTRTNQSGDLQTVEFDISVIVDELTTGDEFKTVPHNSRSSIFVWEKVFVKGTSKTYTRTERIFDITNTYTYSYDGDATVESDLGNSSTPSSGDSVFMDIYKKVNRPSAVYKFGDTNTDSDEYGAFGFMSGYDTSAIGNYSVAQNESTKVEGSAQTAIGTYNKIDAEPSSPLSPMSNSEYRRHSFMIGNGSDNNHRRNAFVVDWDGTISMYHLSKTFSVTSHTISVPAISAHGGQNDLKYNISKDGYYPLCICGWNGGSRHHSYSDMFLEIRQPAHAEIHLSVTNTNDSSISAANCVVYVLWFKLCGEYSSDS